MRRLCLFVCVLFFFQISVNSKEWFDYFAKTNGMHTVQQGYDFDLFCYSPPIITTIENYFIAIEDYMDDIFDDYELFGLKKARSCLGQKGFFVRAFDPNTDCMYLLCFEDKKDANSFLDEYVSIIVTVALFPSFEPLDDIVNLFDDFAFDYTQERSTLKKDIYPFTTYPFRYSKIKKRK